VVDPVEFLGGAEIQVQFRHRLPVKIDHFIGSEYNRSAMFQYPVIGKGFYDQFNPDAVDVAAGNAYNGFCHNLV